MEFTPSKADLRGGPGSHISCRKVFSTGQIAKLFHVAPRTVSKWFDAGKLRGYRLPGSSDRRVLREEVVRFALEHKIDLPELQSLHKIMYIGEDSAIFGEIENSCKESLLNSDMEMQFHKMECVFQAGITVKENEYRAILVDFSVTRTTAISIAKSLRAKDSDPRAIIYGFASEDECNLEELNHGLFDKVWKKPLEVPDICTSLWYDLQVRLGILKAQMGVHEKGADRKKGKSNTQVC